MHFWGWNISDCLASAYNSHRSLILISEGSAWFSTDHGFKVSSQILIPAESQPALIEDALERTSYRYVCKQVSPIA